MTTAAAFGQAGPPGERDRAGLGPEAGKEGQADHDREGPRATEAAVATARTTKAPPPPKPAARTAVAKTAGPKFDDGPEDGRSEGDDDTEARPEGHCDEQAFGKGRSDEGRRTEDDTEGQPRDRHRHRRGSEPEAEGPPEDLRAVGPASGAGEPGHDRGDRLDVASEVRSS